MVWWESTLESSRTMKDFSLTGDKEEDRLREIEGDAHEVYETQMRMLRDMSHIEQRLDELEKTVRVHLHMHQ